LLKEYEPVIRNDRAFIFAPGSSLTLCEVQKCLSTNGLIIAVGTAWRLAPHADILYHADARWWNYHKGVPRFRGQHKISMEKTLCQDVAYVNKGAKHGLDLRPNYLATGGNSGYQAINLAVNHGVKKIILLGYDMKYDEDRRDNFCGNHPPGVTSGYKPQKFERFIKDFNYIVEPLDKLGVQVYNCNIDSALNCFPKERLDNVL